MSDTNKLSPPGTRPGPIRKVSQGGIVLVPWESGMDAGSGYDTVTRTILSSPSARGVTLGHHSVIRPAQKIEMNVTQIESIEKAHEVLQFGSEFNAGYDAFSANALGKFLHETRSDCYSLYFLVVCYAENTDVRVDGFTIDPEFLRMDDVEFRSGFGDYFVSGWVTGGYLVALSEVKATSRQALNKVQAEIGANYSGAFTAGGKFASNWEKWASRSDVQVSLKALWAGMGGKGIEIAPVSGGSPEEPALGRGGGSRGGGEWMALPPLTADDRFPIDDDDDFEDDDEDEEPPRRSAPERSLVRKTEAAVPARGASAPRASAQPFEHAPAGLNPGLGARPEGVDMTMEGLLKAARDLPALAMENGVPLYAILERYAPKYRRVGELTIETAAYNDKRKLLNDAYMKARRIYNSVSYALEKPNQFKTPKKELEAIRTRMEKLKADCERAFEALKRDPALKLPSTIRVPSDADIPAWIGERTTFSPFSVPLNPLLFTKLLDEATNGAFAHANAAARPLLREYLDLVADKSNRNFNSVAEALQAIAIVFPALDSAPGERAESLEGLAEQVREAKEAWQMDSDEIKASYHALEGKSGLDQTQLEFLDYIKPVLFDADKAEDKQRYGFASFWVSLHASLTELQRQVSELDPSSSFKDVVNYGSDKEWSKRAEAFRAEAATIESRIRERLNNG